MGHECVTKHTSVAVSPAETIAARSRRQAQSASVLRARPDCPIGSIPFPAPTPTERGRKAQASVQGIRHVANKKSFISSYMSCLECLLSTSGLRAVQHMIHQYTSKTYRNWSFSVSISLYGVTFFPVALASSAIASSNTLVTSGTGHVGPPRSALAGVDGKTGGGKRERERERGGKTYTDKRRPLLSSTLE